ncbi:DMT family transporter [Candidatus Gottesmanbacteria bacterium]|nr:DMT family transporter [Candidatus Gottesmanbacteria bacterium]
MKLVRSLVSSGPVFIIIAALLWSMDGILRRSLYSLPPEIIVFWEHLLGAIILIPFFFPRLKELKTMTRKEWISVGIVSLFSGALGTIFYTAALGMVAYIQFSVVVLLQQLQPIWAIAAAALLLKEKLTIDFLKWAALGIVAAYFVTFRDLHLNITLGNPTFIAALLALFAGMMWAVSTSFSKIVLNKISYFSATSLRFWLAPIFAFAIAGYQGHTQSFTALTSAQWVTLLGITLSTGMVALVIYYYGLRKTPARVSTICELVWPGSAIFIDYFLYKQTLSVTQIIGVGLLLFSIYHVSKFRK